MTTAFVLSGGANLGAAQVSMLTALQESGVRPDLVIGTSVGALNGPGSPPTPRSTSSATCGGRCGAVRCSRQTRCVGSSGLLVVATTSSAIVGCGGCREVMSDLRRTVNRIFSAR